MKQLINIMVALMFFNIMSAHGAGTSAGTVISNTATVNYNVGASALSATSTPVTVTVQEVIRATLEAKDAGKTKTVAPSQSSAAFKFELTNTGNGNESFLINQSNLNGDEFDVTFDAIYVDTDGDGIFEPGTDDLLYTAAALNPDETITLWVASKDFPNSQANGDGADILVSALSKTFDDAGNNNPAIGDLVAGQGDSGTDAIHATSGNANDQARFVMDTSAITVTINKQIINVDNGLANNSDTAIPDAEVTYRLTIAVEGTGDANNVVVTDPLPSELVLKDGIASGVITVDGADLTAANDADIATYDPTVSPKLITVDFGTITAGTPAVTRTIEFITVIQ